MNLNSKEKNILQKMIVIMILSILLFNFIIPKNAVYAADKSDTTFSNLLARPIVYFLKTTGDILMTLMDTVMTSTISNDDSGLLTKVVKEWKVTLDVDEALDSEKIKELGENETAELLCDGKPDSKGNILVKNANVPCIDYSIDKILKNEVDALNCNFFTKNPKGSAGIIRNSISGWYVALRDIALVVMLSVLVYIIIRALISTISSDRAKYKKMILDWIIAICLLFVMQFVMSATMVFVDKITDLISSTTSASKSIKFQLDGKGEKWYVMSGLDLINVVRLRCESSMSTFNFANVLIYGGLVAYTGIFTYIYLRRLLYVSFLTVIAPLVTITYPIDKVADGTAQGFNKWLKEYIFNVLEQPFHLLIYTVLISSSQDLMFSNPLYGLAAIGFMLPAEKLMRSIFGFDKSSTSAAMGAFGAGALASQAFSAIKSKKDVKDKKGSDVEGTSSPKMMSDDDSDAADIDTSFMTEDETKNSESGPDNEKQNQGYDEKLGQDDKEPEQNTGEGNRTRESLRDKIVNSKRNVAKGYRATHPKGQHRIRKAVTKGTRFVGKAAIRGMGAAVGAGIGLIAGVTTGDPSKAITFAAAGAGAGNVVTGKALNAVTNLGGKGVKKVKDYSKIGKYGIDGAKRENYVEGIMKSNTKEDVAYRDRLAKKFNIENVNSNEGKERLEGLLRTDYELGGNRNIKMIKSADDVMNVRSNIADEDARRKYATQVTKAAYNTKDIKEKLSSSDKTEKLEREIASQHNGSEAVAKNIVSDYKTAMGIKK